ncbi:MAG: FAD-dependent oxidoreductase [Afipia sp.]|nr:FAD-dependent oxidoreductase [Afipia sp.]
MDSNGVVIVGASQAGFQVACSLRSGGYAGPVVLLGAESHAPYQRPPLSKTFLKNDNKISDLPFRPAAFYTDQNIEFVGSSVVSDIDLRNRIAITSTGSNFAFDHLVLTTGARARRLAIPGGSLDGAVSLRSLDDAIALQTRLATAENVVIVGGGFVGLEVGITIASLGPRVTLLEESGRLMGRAVAPETSAFFLRAHREKGVTILLNARASSIDYREGRVISVKTAEGQSIPADLVVVGIGAEPRQELAEAMGLVTNRGIVVDDCGRASVPGVYAAGDNARHPHPYGVSDLSLIESVQNAVDQAKSVASAILGQTVPHCSVPWFWSDQGDIKLQIAGVCGSNDDVVVRGNPEEGRFSALHFRQGRLVAVDSVNSPADHIAARKLIAQHVQIAPAALADAQRPLKSFL